MQSIKSYLQHIYFPAVELAHLSAACGTHSHSAEMFSCVNAKDHITRSQTENDPQHDQTRNTSLQQHPSADQNTPSSLSDREMLDRVLEEGIKLKKRCKSLRISLMESENKRSEDQINFNKRLNIAESTLQTTASEMKAQHFMELTHTRESRLFELENLTHQVNTLQMEKKESEDMIQQLKTRVFALQDEKRDFQLQKAEFINHVNSTLEQEKIKHELEVENWQLQVAEKVKAMEMLTQEKSTLQHQMQALQQEKKLQKLANPCQDCEALKHDLTQQKCELSHMINAQKVEFASLHHQLEDAKFELSKAHDEKVYLQDENVRLEKQVVLMKSEVMRATSPPADFRNVLKSDKEQRLISELQNARLQVSELQQALDTLLQAKINVEQGVTLVVQENERLQAQIQRASVAAGQKRSEEQPLKLEMMHEPQENVASAVLSDGGEMSSLLQGGMPSASRKSTRRSITSGR